MHTDTKLPVNSGCRDTDEWREPFSSEPSFSKRYSFKKFLLCWRLVRIKKEGETTESLLYVAKRPGLIASSFSFPTVSPIWVHLFIHYFAGTKNTFPFKETGLFTTPVIAINALLPHHGYQNR